MTGGIAITTHGNMTIEIKMDVNRLAIEVSNIPTCEITL